jgi:hypothetical protein
MYMYSVGPSIWHPRIQKDLKSVFSVIFKVCFPVLVMFKTHDSQFFDSPTFASGTTVSSVHTTSRRQLVCLGLFSHCLGNIVGFAGLVLNSFTL